MRGLVSNLLFSPIAAALLPGERIAILSTGRLHLGRLQPRFEIVAVLEVDATSMIATADGRALVLTGYYEEEDADEDEPPRSSLVVVGVHERALSKIAELREDVFALFEHDKRIIALGKRGAFEVKGIAEAWAEQKPAPYVAPRAIAPVRPLSAIGVKEITSRARPPRRSPRKTTATLGALVASLVARAGKSPMLELRAGDTRVAKTPVRADALAVVGNALFVYGGPITYVLTATGADARLVGTTRALVGAWTSKGAFYVEDASGAVFELQNLGVSLPLALLGPPLVIDLR